MTDTKPSILIIDDDRFVMSYWKKALEYRGYEVTICADADAAFDHLQTRPVTLIILDIMLPPKKRYSAVDTVDGLYTGVFVYQDIRKLYPNLPIIVLTNVKDEGALGQFPVHQDANLRVEEKTAVPPIYMATLVGQMLT